MPERDPKYFEIQEYNKKLLELSKREINPVDLGGGSYNNIVYKKRKKILKKSKKKYNLILKKSIKNKMNIFKYYNSKILFLCFFIKDFGILL
jgi:hypothetical protein